MTPAADAIPEVAPPVAPDAGVRLDDGEIVLFATRQHWSVPMLLGGAPSLLLLGFLALLALQRPSPMPSPVPFRCPRSSCFPLSLLSLLPQRAPPPRCMSQGTRASC